VSINTANLTVTRRKQTPFGQNRGAAPAWPTERGFVGGTNDATGLVHLGAREYDPALGRFISVDPLIDTADPQQMNGYAYANNSPVTSSDPTGLIEKDPKGEGTGSTAPPPTRTSPPPAHCFTANACEGRYDGGGGGTSTRKRPPPAGCSTANACEGRYDDPPPSGPCGGLSGWEVGVCMNHAMEDPCTGLAGWEIGVCRAHTTPPYRPSSESPPPTPLPPAPAMVPLNPPLIQTWYEHYKDYRYGYASLDFCLGSCIGLQLSEGPAQIVVTQIGAVGWSATYGVMDTPTSEQEADGLSACTVLGAGGCAGTGRRRDGGTWNSMGVTAGEELAFQGGRTHSWTLPVDSRLFTGPLCWVASCFG
jgi:RHS repeat-associated protein